LAKQIKYTIVSKVELMDMTKTPPQPITLVSYITELGGAGTVSIPGHNLPDDRIKRAVEEDIRKRGGGPGMLTGTVTL